MTAIVRPVQPSDQRAVGDIAFGTGFFGQSARVYFPAPGLFRALWVAAYFRGAGFAGFVAEVDGQIVGYVLGAPDGNLYQQGLRRAAPEILAALPTWGLLGCLPYLGRAALWHAPQADPVRFPAHLHLNLLPDARGHRLGERLLRAHLRTLAGAGVPGVQLSTTTENAAALGLYRKVGFQVAHRRATPLWTPWLGRAATQVVMTLDLSRPDLLDL
ncbi:GNAT family N-acetyltransferase [Deinococcus sedimenti]|uniref:N-acetyltransferase n=1 Tax=Deinococcus sedimenti TaxID=1867090 RepID=A0ABQ2RZ05_9DEIO|nr:GNAT family N-acetyltransferase [Deinococcus sedimenti]GGR81210.1 N-acetyltransferase [Deinococcus sedimenti]